MDRPICSVGRSLAVVAWKALLELPAAAGGAAGGLLRDYVVKRVIRLVRLDAWWQVGLDIVVEPVPAVLFGFPDLDNPPAASRISLTVA